jgi:hypothetical protein
MMRSLLAVFTGIGLGAFGMAAVQHGGHGAVRTIADTFYEPTGCLHRVSKSAAAKGKTRVLAVVVHPRDAKQVVIPESAK